jgi:hypothetical protein
MNWHPEILPSAQRDLWESRLSKGFPGWVLYGGTGLALRLGHRVSVDFVFFSSRALSPLSFRDRHGLDGEVLQAAPNTLTLLHRGVKLSFFGGLTLRVVRAPDVFGGCAVASLEDLAACKLAALVNRVEAKDYLDVAALLRHGMALGRMLACADAVYRGEFPVAVCLKSLTWFESPELATIPAEDRDELIRAVRAVEEIPEVAAMGTEIGGG